MKRSICLLIAVFLFLPLISLAEDSGALNILLLGSDNFGYVSVTDKEEISRADAIFLLSIQPKSKQIKLLSIERDYLVTLPDGLGENKLATATYFGGPEMAIKAVNKLFDININMYAHIDIYNMISAIDLFGGVDVEVLPQDLDRINAFIADIRTVQVEPLQAGINHLNGMQAWAFMGERNHDLDAIASNAERNNRQKLLFAAAMDKVLVMKIPALIQIVSDVLPLIQTNISMNELLKIIESILTFETDEIAFGKSPVGGFSLKKINMHRLLVPDDMVAETFYVHQFLGEE